MGTRIAYLAIHLLSIGDIYKLLNLIVEEKLTLSALTATTATLLGLLIPLAIFLQKVPGSDAVETATIQIRIINIKLLVYAFVFICLTFLLWGINSIKILLLLSYAIGIILILSTLVKSVRWITDWSSEPETGYRYAQETKLIKKSKLTINQRKLVWEARLKEMSETASKNGVYSSYDNKLVEEFKANYEQLGVKDHSWIVNETFRRLNSEYSKNNWYNGSFLNYSFKIIWNLIRNERNHTEPATDIMLRENYYDLKEELNTWENNIKGAFKLLGKNPSQYFLLTPIVEEYTQKADNEEDRKFLAERIFDSLYASEYLQGLNYGSNWKISYQSLASDKDHTNTQWILLRTFLDRIEKEEVDNFNCTAKETNLIKNDLVFESIFTNADPILFGQLITLFFSLKRGVDFNDPSYVRQRLLTPCSMGNYRSDPIFLGNPTTQQIDKEDTNPRKYKEKNTLNIWMLLNHRRNEKDKEYFEYVSTLQNLFDAVLQDMEEVSETDQNMLKNKIKALRNAIELVSTLRTKIKKS